MSRKTTSKAGAKPAAKKSAKQAAKQSDRNPQRRGPQPPFEGTDQEPPGLDSEMRPAADHGESSYVGHGRLEGRVALVTGADSGIGRAVALAFAREGADVLISYLSEDSDADETVRLVEDAGRRAIAVAGDIGQEAHCRTLVERTVRELGRLDVLVNNAAFQRTHDSIAELSTEEFDRTYKTNVYAMFWLCRYALPHLPAGGSIINTASIQAYEPSASLLAYASTKGAIVTFSKALSSEVIEQGVRVNVVAPGPVWTPLIPATMPAEQVKTFGQDTPIGRPAQPAELAPVYVFLASDDARFITGEVIGVTGGKPLP
jgi:NAD(P)-dependent dehydrogenase (short-subunit alcohol dehydrogenase family)